MSFSVDSLIQQLDEMKQTIASLGLDAKQKTRVATAASSVLGTVQSPIDKMMQAFIMLGAQTIIRTFMEWKVFENIPLQGTISYQDLAAKVGAETNLIARYAAMLVSTEFLHQTGTDQVGHTDSSKLFIGTNHFSALIKLNFDTHFQSLSRFPAYYAKYGRKEPTGRYDSIQSYAMGDPKMTVWEHVNARPELLEAFMASMVAMSHRDPVTGTYDFGWVVQEGGKADPQRTLLVDVGGGRGHAVQAICEATPGLAPSRCVVEDMEEEVEEARKSVEGLLKETKFLAMDFHKEQPVQGALLYYIRRCLHDYGDAEAVQMLQQIQKAMAADSRLCIAENIINNPPKPMGAVSDLIMSTLGGKERTMEGWEMITSQAGLKITQVARSDATEMAVIECMKA